ncbi:MAG: DUF4190 domain-containing protein [Planctomycetes bacterium]|nr:DUF4190 domain-containing protein [Planctomycetota bacterium]
MPDPTHPPTTPVSPPIPQGGHSVELRTGLAITALILGIVGMPTCLPGIAAIVVGIIALSRIARKPERYGGRGMAIAGIALGGASAVMFPVFLLFVSILLPSLSRARELSKRLVCSANMRAVAISAKTYAEDNDGMMPTPLSALVDEGYLTPRQLICPSSGLNKCNYRLLGIDPAEPTDGRTPFLYEPKSNHGGEGGNIVFADGQATFERAQSYDKILSARAPPDDRDTPDAGSGD